MNKKSRKSLPMDQTWIVLGFIIVLPMIAFLIVMIMIYDNPVWIGVISAILGFSIIIFVILIIAIKKKNEEQSIISKKDIKYIKDKIRADDELPKR